MSWFDGRGRALDQRRALIGRPSLRRALSALPADREQAITDQLGADFDPARDKSRYRQELQRAIETENTAAPLREYERLDGLLRDPKLSFDQRKMIEERQKRLPKPGSLTVDARFDPRDSNSVAFQQFGSLYRNF